MAQLTMTSVLAAVAITSAAACGSSSANNPPQTPASTTTTTSGDPSVSTATVDHADGNIAACIRARDKVEIDQASEALKRSTDPRIRELAQRILNDRDAMERDEQATASLTGIVPVKDEKSFTVEAKGEIARTSLGLASDSDFDKTFLDITVREQQGFLTALDNKLIPEAQNANLKAMLERTRAKVADDLASAKDIQASRAK